jgi:hypothetical protein
MFGTVSTPLVLNGLRSYVGKRRRFWIRLMTLGLIAAAGALFAAVGLGAHVADSFIEGTKWAGVGAVIAIMSLFYGGITLVGPLQEVATLSRQLAWQVLINAVSLLALIGVMRWYGALTPALLYAVGAVSIARTLAYVVFIWRHLGEAEDSARWDFAVSGAKS